MEKPAVNQYALHELIRRRWSPRAFAEKPVELAKLQSIFEAARWGPSAMNEQPWSFIVARKENPPEFELLFSCLAEGNQPWAAKAPVLILVVAKNFFEANASPNRWALYDVGLATENMLLQALDLGLFAHVMAGFEGEKARTLFQIPPAYEPVSILALGYPGDYTTLSEPYQERELAPRTRKPLETFVFAGQWGQTAAIKAE